VGWPRLLNSRERPAVTLARYFIVVGGALAVLLLIAGWSLPEFPERFPDRPEVISRANIRIRSAHKLPERIVLDTSQPTIPTPSIEVVLTEQMVARLPDEMTDQARVESLARQNPDARPIDAHRRPARARRRPVRAFSSTHEARTRYRSEPPAWGTGEECCRFEWAGRPATSKAASRKRVARRNSWAGWHFPEVN
jgi:hypothetical protein